MTRQIFNRGKNHKSELFKLLNSLNFFLVDGVVYTSLTDAAKKLNMSESKTADYFSTKEYRILDFENESDKELIITELVNFYLNNKPKTTKLNFKSSVFKKFLDKKHKTKPYEKESDAIKMSKKRRNSRPVFIFDRCFSSIAEAAAYYNTSTATISKYIKSKDDRFKDFYFLK